MQAARGPVNPARPGSGGPPPPRGGPGGRSDRPAALVLVAALVAALVGAAHWPVLGARALAFDDAEYIGGDALVSRPGWPSVGRFFAEVLDPSSVRGYYHPLSMTSLMLDVAMGGSPEDPRAFHRTSLALHMLGAALVVLILQRLFGALVPAALAGLAFGLHPLTVEPVAWIAERKTLLATALALACVFCHVEYCRREARGWLHAALVLNALALLAKPTVMTLPILLLILDHWPLRRLSARTVVEKWPFLLLSGVSGAIAFASQRATAGFGEAGTSPGLPGAFYALAFYLRKIVWPVDLSSAYPVPAPLTLSHPAVGPAVALVCALTLLLVLLARRAPGPLAGWTCFVVAIAPTLGLVSHSWMLTSDKYAYFPAFGLVLVAGWGLAAAWTSRRSAGAARKAALIVPVIAVLALEARGVRETLRPWADSLTLHRHMERVAPDAPAVHAQLGLLLTRSGERAQGTLHLRRALELEPRYPAAHYNLGNVLAAEGRLEEAIQHFRAADALLPDDPPTVFGLGLSLRLAGRPLEAEAELQRVLRLDPGNVEAATELAGALLAQGRAGEAAERFRAALTRAPGSARLHYGLASALRLSDGDRSQVQDHLRQAMRHDPGWPQPFNDLAWLLATSADPAVREPDEALRLAARAVELTGGTDPTVLDTRAAAEAASGRFDAAVETERRAIELATRAGRPVLAAALSERMRLYRSGNAYVEEGRPGGRR